MDGYCRRKRPSGERALRCRLAAVHGALCAFGERIRGRGACGAAAEVSSACRLPPAFPIDTLVAVNTLLRALRVDVAVRVRARRSDLGRPDVQLAGVQAGEGVGRWRYR